jgi:hypothetical protein
VSLRPSLFSRLVEHCTLRATRAARPTTSEATRALRSQLDRAEASLEHAREQWREGDGDAALEALREAERTFDDALGPSGSALQRAASPYAPLPDDARRSIATFNARWSDLAAALDRVRPAAAPAARNLTLLLWRWAVAIALVVFFVDGTRSILERRATKTTASASWGVTYPPENIRDHNFDTSWLLPDGATGWIHAAFSARSVRAVKIYSVRRLPSYGAKLATVDFELSGRVVHSAPIDLSSTLGQSAPHVLALPAPLRVDAVRLTIRSFHGLGGGVGELEIE